MKSKWFWLLLLCSASCSASKQIAASASEIGHRATEIHARATDIAAKSQDAEIRKDAETIAEQAEGIVVSTEAIHKALPGVTDKTPWWADMIKWIAIAAAGIAVAWVIHASGIGMAIRIAIGWIPKKQVQEAVMARDTLDSNKPETIREWVAMKRASDPAFDAAWQKTGH
jgi:hypothetical protein